MKVRASRGVAFCGVMGALSIALMQLGVVVPVFLYIAPITAGLFVLVAREECGTRMAWTMYAAVALLSILFIADKEVAFTFVFLTGPYPLCKPSLDRIPWKLLRMTIKLVYFNLMLLMMYGLLVLLFFPGLLAGAWQGEGLVMTLSLWLIGNVAFILFDRALVNLLLAYRIAWQPKLHKMLRY